MATAVKRGKIRDDLKALVDADDVVFVARIAQEWGSTTTVHIG